ncbi:hypothetical protein EDB81DRAFT_444602 [Dactylonectria macrodidyma]|uniref:Zn(2)-C6 fungal-type domain-containing protein n=1 Tax=Dactylonectria macrodidyma TaxID=307937 RepID=A0A9P9JDH5_9HYPO|nr:hypothetical protein EDB81DRAFT_444602 [Dactylonectria macrodidyma]
MDCNPKILVQQPPASRPSEKPPKAPQKPPNVSGPTSPPARSDRLIIIHRGGISNCATCPEQPHSLAIILSSLVVKSPNKQMHSPSPVPHPNQVRSACQRCRRQKLRCVRLAAATTSSPPSSSCARCSRLGLSCESGSQRRIGRPTKRDTARVKASGPGPSADEMPFLDSLPDDDGTAPSSDWAVAFNAQFGLGCPETMPLESWPRIQDVELPLPVPELSSCQVVLPSISDFETLSRLNVDVRKGLEYIERYKVQPTFSFFICATHDGIDGMNGYKNAQMLMTHVQQFLDIIKALHRQLGTRITPAQANPPSPNPFTLALDPSIIGSGTPSPTGVSSTRASPGDDSPLSATHDAPTLLLVISCYVQLIKHIETALKIVYDSVNNPVEEVVVGAPMSYADVPVIHVSTQFILFCELLTHAIAQVNLVLGLPSPWSGRSAWTGLLRHERYRNLLNAELGSVEGAWTTRPAKLLEKTRKTKEIFVELSMLGLDS